MKKAAKKKGAKKKSIKAGRSSGYSPTAADITTRHDLPIPTKSELREQIDLLRVGESKHMDIRFWPALRNAASNAKRPVAGRPAKQFTVHRSTTNPSEVGVWRTA